MDEEIKQAYYSVIQKWLTGEKRYALESRTFIGETEIPNGEFQFRFRTVINSLDSASTVVETDRFETNCYFGNLHANLEKLSIFLETLTYEAYEKMEEPNN